MVEGWKGFQAKPAPEPEKKPEVIAGERAVRLTKMLDRDKEAPLPPTLEAVLGEADDKTFVKQMKQAWQSRPGLNDFESVDQLDDAPLQESIHNMRKGMLLPTNSLASMLEKAVFQFDAPDVRACRALGAFLAVQLRPDTGRVDLNSLKVGRKKIPDSVEDRMVAWRLGQMMVMAGELGRLRLKPDLRGTAEEVTSLSRWKQISSASDLPVQFHLLAERVLLRGDRGLDWNRLVPPVEKPLKGLPKRADPTVLELQGKDNPFMQEPGKVRARLEQYVRYLRTEIDGVDAPVAEMVERFIEGQEQLVFAKRFTVNQKDLSKTLQGYIPEKTDTKIKKAVRQYLSEGLRVDLRLSDEVTRWTKSQDMAALERSVPQLKVLQENKWPFWGEQGEQNLRDLRRWTVDALRGAANKPPEDWPQDFRLFLHAIADHLQLLNAESIAKSPPK